MSSPVDPLRHEGCARQGLVVPVRTDPTGQSGPTAKQARGPRWRRTSRGLYVPSSVDGHDVEQRIVEAAAVLPTIGGVTGWAALRWCGAGWFSGLLGDGFTRAPVTLVTNCADIRPQTGIAVSAERMNPRDFRVIDGMCVTLSERSVLFEMRYAGTLEDAVVTADMAMQADLTSTVALRRYAGTLAGWTGIPLARRALDLVDENSWSPQETRMRLVWVLQAGLPTPLCNVPVFDLSGNHIGTPDLLEPISGVVGEYDGALHLEGRQRGVDVRREHAFRDAGLEFFSVVAADWQDRDGLTVRMRASYHRALRRGEERRWTLDQPPWWAPTDTVARRLALSEAERSRLLRSRAG
jgi:hypothetical protein